MGMTEHPRAETVIRAGVSALPSWIGGPLGEVWFGHRDRARLARVEDFLRELRNQLTHLDRDRVDFAYLKSDEFADLLEAVVQRAQRARREDQRSRLSQILCGQMTDPIPIDFAELFLDLVMELNASQLQILEGHLSCPPEHAKPSYRTPRYYGLNQGQYRYYVQVLISRGLLLEQHLPKTGIGERHRPFQRLEITELGKEFLKFLEHGDMRTNGCTPTK